MNRGIQNRRLQELRDTVDAGGQLLLGVAMGAVFVLARTWGRRAWARGWVGRGAHAYR
jgi:hypothetical protein